jgi:hypothetical protein
MTAHQPAEPPEHRVSVAHRRGSRLARHRDGRPMERVAAVGCRDDPHGRARHRPGPLGERVAAVVMAGFLLDLPVPSREPSEVHRAVDEVLSRPEFRPAAQPLLDRIWTWVLTRLGELLASLTATTAGSIIGLVLFIAILILLALLATRFARTMSRSPEVDAAIVTPPRRGADEWRVEAEAHEAAGEWRQAVRCRYRALVADLSSRGVVEEVPGRTSGEYRGEVGRNLPGAAEAFAGATEVFDRAWYGRRPTGKGEVERFRNLAGRVLERVPGEPPRWTGAGMSRALGRAQR